MNIKDELLKGLTEEQIEKARKCKNEKELLELAKSEKINLTDEQLASISGGYICEKTKVCPYCGSDHVQAHPRSDDFDQYRCYDCGAFWD